MKKIKKDKKIQAPIKDLKPSEEVSPLVFALEEKKKKIEDLKR